MVSYSPHGINHLITEWQTYTAVEIGGGGGGGATDNQELYSPQGWTQSFTESVNACVHRLQALVYHILSPTTAMTGYAKGLETDSFSLELKRQQVCNRRPKLHQTFVL